MFEDQLACADLVLLTKADLAGPEGVAKAREIIAAEAPRPLPMVEAVDGIVSAEIVLGLEAAAEDDIAARPSHHDGADDHEHDDFDSISVMLGEVESPEAIAARIVTLAEQQDILRVKGYAAVAASRCGCWSRRSAAGCAPITTGLGARANRAAPGWSSSPSMTGSTRPRSRPC
ncbi:cobalamin biosynthesis protein CobW [Sphingomonas paucimobilis]|nr:cobalamin biosynthesis protein CobW [Sphingomonas paucimobilis]